MPLARTQQWPQVVPGIDQPWDLAFNGLIGTPPDDPGINLSVFRSGHITSSENPEDDNLMGYMSLSHDVENPRRRFVVGLV